MATIAITCMHNYQGGYSRISDGYIKAIEQAGGGPIVLPPALSPSAGVKLLSLADGLLLTGGNDLSPFLYGREPHPQLGDGAVRRDEQEPLLIKEALRLGLPILGVCRGMQIINVTLGGTIIQHINQEGPEAIQHRQNSPGWRRHHHVDIKSGTRLAGILGSGAIGVNSHHHQAVEKLAPGLEVSAYAPDGTIEAVESASPWITGVQWHPEMMFEHYPEFLKIFQAFVAACAGQK